MNGEDARLEPTSSVLDVCDALDEARERFVEAAKRLRVGTFEADVEALLMFNLGVRHAQSVTTLARHDLGLLPSAFVLARALFECCARAAWLVDEAEPLRREARWIAHLDGEVSALDRTAKRSEAAGLAVDAIRNKARSIREFGDRVATALTAQGIPLLKQVPDFATILSSIGGDDLYTTYIEASQYAHGGHQATWLYRGRGLGTEKVIGEWIVPQNWILPLRMCWLAIGHPGDMVLARLSRNDAAGCSHESATRIDVAFQRLVIEPIHSLDGPAET